MSELLSILIVDDHAVVREGVVKIVSALDNVKYYDEAENGQVAMDKLEQKEFDVVILDIEMQVMNGIETASRIKKEYKNTKIIMFSMYNERKQVTELIELGIDAYILKSADRNELIKALNHITIGGKYFTPEVYEVWADYSSSELYRQDKLLPKFSQREKDIIILLCQGLSAKQVADKVFVSYNTVATHRAHIMKKMGVNSFQGLMSFAITHKVYIP